jgi:hypothetical protein
MSGAALARASLAQPVPLAPSGVVPLSAPAPALHRNTKGGCAEMEDGETEAPLPKATAAARGPVTAGALPLVRRVALRLRSRL